MMIATLFFFLLTIFLFLFYIMKLFFLSDRRLEKRMEKYLSLPNQTINREKFNLFLHFQLTKQRIRKNVLSKDKNNKIETMIARAGIPIKPEEYVLFQWLSTALLGGLLLLISGNVLFLPFGSLLGFFFPRWYLKKKQRARMAKFNESLPDMISTIVGSLRAGFSFPQALKTVTEEADSPLKEEMETVLKEMQYGNSLEEALHSLIERMPSEDLDLMVQAILIQRQVGGNLATVLDKIVSTIRDRTKIQRQIKTLTAQGRLSGIVIAIMPFVLALFLYLIEPEYIGTLFYNPIGIGMVIVAVISGIIGFFMIKKITTIEV
ncbi:MAG TPA: type II secretion system F family protein [Pseudoneobacillus sp.]|nr:type II secretion system F family protein [Pseudoneobacillus sp.]